MWDVLVLGYNNIQKVPIKNCFSKSKEAWVRHLGGALRTGGAAGCTGAAGCATGVFPCLEIFFVNFSVNFFL